jgi:hypothetical protein
MATSQGSATVAAVRDQLKTPDRRGNDRGPAQMIDNVTLREKGHEHFRRRVNRWIFFV